MTLQQLQDAPACRRDANFSAWLSDRKNRRAIPHRLESCGYVLIRNEYDTRDGLWRIVGKRARIYARVELLPRERTAAAQELVRAKEEELKKAEEEKKAAAEKRQAEADKAFKGPYRSPFDDDVVFADGPETFVDYLLEDEETDNNSD